MNHEPQTIGGLFKDLECELNSLAISMEHFINILNEISQRVEETKNNEVVNMFLAQLIGSLRITVKNQLDFSPES
jgi:vacuolar-type H+-ATPase catalytic subunit A/Vma1